MSIPKKNAKLPRFLFMYVVSIYNVLRFNYLEFYTRADTFKNEYGKLQTQLSS